MVSLLQKKKKPRQASLTRDILLRDVKLFGFMKKLFHFAMSTSVNYYFLCIYILMIDVVFFLCDTFPTVLTAKLTTKP